jgi:hypothetical protein
MAAGRAAAAERAQANREERLHGTTASDHTINFKAK